MTNRLNILFTCAGRRVALIEAFRKSMAELGIEGKILATDITPASAALQAADEALIVPRAGTLEYAPTIRDLVKKHKVGLVVPLTDIDLRSLARQQGDLIKAGATVMVGEERTIKAIRDKRSFNSLLARAGLPTIRTFSLQQFHEDPFYPCFAKPFRGSAGYGTSRIDDENDLRKHLHVFGDQLLIQDYVPGQEYTIDVYRTREGQVKAIVPRQRLLVRCGEVDQGMTVDDRELLDATADLCELLDDLWGVFCVQCRRPKGGQPHFFELNPRFGGGVPLSIAAGADLPRYLLQEVTGRAIEGGVGQFTPNLLMLRYAQAYFTTIEDARKLPGYDAPIIR